MDKTARQNIRVMLTIDKNLLDDEWEKQAELCYEYGEKLADAKLEVAELKADLKLLVANLDEIIRDEDQDESDDPKEKKKKKTETQIDHEITRHPKYQKRLKALREAEHRVDLLGVACDAIVDRKQALSKLSDLFGMQYFSGPSQKTKDALAGVRDKKKKRRTDDDE